MLGWGGYAQKAQGMAEAGARELLGGLLALLLLFELV